MTKSVVRKYHSKYNTQFCKAVAVKLRQSNVVYKRHTQQLTKTALLYRTAVT